MVSNEKESIYKTIGSLIVGVNVICALISFFIIWAKGSLFWALVALGIYAISTTITVMPFFALDEAFARIERLELETFNINNRFRRPIKQEKKRSVFLRKKHKNKIAEDDYKGFCFDNEVAGSDRRPKEPKKVKKNLDNGTWQCYCGTINQSYIGTCSCGEEKPR